MRAAPIHEEAEIEAVMAALARERRVGLLVLPEILSNMHRAMIVAFAARYRVPMVYAFRFFAEAGGLMSYGLDQADTFRRAAGYVDRILRGAKPADLPVQAPTKFDMVLNLKTANTLGVTFVPWLLGSADEVIE